MRPRRTRTGDAGSDTFGHQEAHLGRVAVVAAGACRGPCHRTCPPAEGAHHDRRPFAPVRAVDLNRRLLNYSGENRSDASNGECVSCVQAGTQNTVAHEHRVRLLSGAPWSPLESGPPTAALSTTPQDGSCAPAHGEGLTPGSAPTSHGGVTARRSGIRRARQHAGRPAGPKERGDSTRPRRTHGNAVSHNMSLPLCCGRCITTGTIPDPNLVMRGFVA